MPDEYISREAMLEHLDRCKQSEDATTLTAAVITALQCFVQSQPTADVAEVVRCASCKYVRPTVNAHTGEQVGIWCCLHDILNVSPDEYCSRGEKKGATNERTAV